MVKMDMRYMWSEIDSPAVMSKRFQPSRLVVFRRSRRWKKGIGEVGFEGTGVGRAERAAWGVGMGLYRLSRRYHAGLEKVVYLILETMASKMRHFQLSLSLDDGRLVVSCCSPSTQFLGLVGAAKPLQISSGPS